MKKKPIKSGSKMWTPDEKVKLQNIKNPSSIIKKK